MLISFLNSASFCELFRDDGGEERYFLGETDTVSSSLGGGGGGVLPGLEMLLSFLCLLWGGFSGGWSIDA